MNFSADHVWALAVIADRINGGYEKDDVGKWDEATDKWIVTKTANKVLVKGWLREGNITPTATDIEQGQECRAYFKGFLMKQLAGRLNDFEAQALRIAQIDEFKGNMMLEFAVVSCLPSTMRRDKARQDIAREIYGSTQLQGNIGDKIEGEIEVVKCHYSQNYDKFRVTARLGDAFIDFWFSKECQAGDRFNIKGKIKSVRGDKTTQLNFVKRG